MFGIDVQFQTARVMISLATFWTDVFWWNLQLLHFNLVDITEVHVEQARSLILFLTNVAPPGSGDFWVVHLLHVSTNSGTSYE